MTRAFHNTKANRRKGINSQKCVSYALGSIKQAPQDWAQPGGLNLEQNLNLETTGSPQALELWAIHALFQCQPGSWAFSQEPLSQVEIRAGPVRDTSTVSSTG